MATPDPGPADPIVEAHLTGVYDYNDVQRWAFEQQTSDAWRGVPMVTVSLTRGIDGRWHGHLYGWPAAPARPPLPPAGADTDVWRSRPFADLGMIASHRAEGPVPVVPGHTYVGEGTSKVYPAGTLREGDRVELQASGSFFVPHPAFDSAIRAAAQAEQDTARRAVYTGDARPLELDLHTEAPPARREGRRARREREVREAAEATAQQAVDAADAMAASVTVPPSGHRPDSTGLAPVEYPLCESKIPTHDRGVIRCARKHRPGTAILTHSAHGYIWKDGDTRSPIND